MNEIDTANESFGHRQSHLQPKNLKSLFLSAGCRSKPTLKSTVLYFANKLKALMIAALTENNEEGMVILFGDTFICCGQSHSFILLLPSADQVQNSVPITIYSNQHDSREVDHPFI